MIRWAITLGLAVLASPIKAETCRLALALAMDISVSVDEAEDVLQRQGLAAALIAPEVQEAFFPLLCRLLWLFTNGAVGPPSTSF